MAGSMKDIKLRIKSVESTMQITKAMELVASSKMRRAKERVEHSRPYFETLHETLTGIAAADPRARNPYLRRDEINAASPLGLCQFASFEVERYSDAVEPELGISPREYMGKLLNYCRGYAAKFSQNSPNLLFMGHTGLGKTHLALAIADAVLEGGHDVLYTSAAALAAQLGREHFNYTTNDEWLAACQEADLLILDDLGTEYITPLTISVLYELINTRMLTHRPTIYTTNITDQSVFVARYTEKVSSRMLGGCKMFKFFGTDQRLK